MNRPVRGLSFLSISVLGRRTILATLVALLILPATSQAGALFEVNTFSVSGVNAGETNTGTTVDFLQSYDVVPLVFVLDNTADSKVALRVTNVTKTGFDVYQVHHSGDGIANPAGEDLTAHDVAANSDLTYFVIVPGTYNVNGATIEAGSVQASGNRSYKSITFDSSFAEEPSVLTNIQTMNNETLVGEAGEGGMSAPWRVTMMPNDGGAEGGGIKTTGFRVALDQMQVNDGVSAALDETIGWVAVSAGHGTLSSDGYTLADALGALTTAEYDSQITANAVAAGLYTADFTTAFPTGSSPVVLAGPATIDGGDGYWVERGTVTETGVQLRSMEDTWLDTEVGHADEAVSLLAFQSSLQAYVSTQEVFWDNSDATTDPSGTGGTGDGLWSSNTNWRNNNTDSQDSPPNNVLPSVNDVVNIGLNNDTVGSGSSQYSPVTITDGDDFEVDSIRVGTNPGLSIGGHGDLIINGGELRVYDHSPEDTAIVGSGTQPERGSLNLGADNGRTGTLTVTGTGVLRVENAINLGLEAGTTGKLTLSGGTIEAGSLNVSSGDGVGTVTISGGSLTVGELNQGNTQDGSVTQTGGTVIINGDLNFGKIGDQGGVYHITDGSLTVTGQVKERDPSVDSAQLYVDVDNEDANPDSFTVGGDITVQSFRVGQNAGQTGRWTLPDGSRIINTGTMFVGNNGTGVLTVDDTVGSVATPTIEVSNALRVGAGEANANVGDGTLYFLQGVIDVNGGGMYVAGQDAASNESNTTGTVVMGTSGGSLTGAQLFTRGSNLEVGRGGTGVFTQYSGTVTVETSNLILGQAATGDGTYTIYDGKLETLAGQIRVGNTGLGVFNQEGGEVISKGTLDLGNSNDPASDGTYNLRGGSLTVNGSLLVGNLAKGVFNFEGGTFTFGNTLHVASDNANADGTLNLGTASGPTVALETTQFEVGRHGTGVVNHVNADVDVNVNGANNLVISQYSDGYATYNMIGGTLDVLSGSQGNLNFNAGTGVFNQTGGTVTLHGGDVNMTNNATGDATYNLKGGLLDLGGGNVDPGPGTETFNFTGGTLKNVGTFGFTLTQDDTDGLSVLAPGASPGTMNVSGDYNMLGGVYEVEISDSANDYVIVSGDATLDGQLQVLLLGGYDPPFGSTYNVLTAQNVTLETNFGIDSSLTAGYGFYYTLISGGNGQILQLTAVPEPSTLVGLAGMALAGLLFLRRRKKA